ncbi:MAG: hypothetical protein DCF23_04830 [Cyanobium sp.]|nr:MAG: hypothetical protein DCF23_04830 [Cyanobium sp.]
MWAAGLGFYNGLMVQLRSIGPGLCADRWLFEEAPELRGLQAAVLQEQVQQNVPSINADIDRLAPAAVVKASRGMNAAYAFQAAELVGLPPLAVPYQAAGFEALARELITTTQEQATTADPDREMIDGQPEPGPGAAGAGSRRAPRRGRCAAAAGDRAAPLRGAG